MSRNFCFVTWFVLLCCTQIIVSFMLLLNMFVLLLFLMLVTLCTLDEFSNFLFSPNLPTSLPGPMGEIFSLWF